MRDHHQELTDAGADVAAIGMGWPEMAKHFKEEFAIPFPLLVDHKKETYRALDLERGTWWRVIGPPVWIKGVRAIMQHPNKRPKQDPMQLGGVAVVDEDGQSLLLHRSKTTSDNPSIEKLVAALR